MVPNPEKSLSETMMSSHDSLMVSYFVQFRFNLSKRFLGAISADGIRHKIY